MHGFCEHIGLFSNNPDRLVAFYKKVLKFELESTQTIDKKTMKAIFGIGHDCLMAKLKKDTLLVEIFSGGSIRFRKPAKNCLGYNHWGYFVQDREAFLKNLKTKTKILKIRRGGRLVYFIKDPDSNLIELRD